MEKRKVLSVSEIRKFEEQLPGKLILGAALTPILNDYKRLRFLTERLMMAKLAGNTDKVEEIFNELHEIL